MISRLACGFILLFLTILLRRADFLNFPFKFRKLESIKDNLPIEKIDSIDVNVLEPIILSNGSDKYSPFPYLLSAF
ncbi:hypothetical protein QR98_0059140 [Sarcoptes scabiei]|uniref:Uncharacterized protein n=1 Tax=Sarcoptes scabiei TaxID=52283 RepID=A0A132A8V3_SARSC|nr:hypothetical protein QR98_0059140 [Sarcoptes scabiei]